jgi:hypothetical protein
MYIGFREDPALLTVHTHTHTQMKALTISKICFVIVITFQLEMKFENHLTDYRFLNYQVIHFNKLKLIHMMHQEALKWEGSIEVWACLLCDQGKQCSCSLSL